MKKLLLAVLLLLSGCSTFSLTSPDGTTISHTRFFDDTKMEEVKIKSKDFEGTLGNFENNGQIDMQALMKVLKALSMVQ